MSRGLARWDERAQRALPPLLVLAAFLKELGKEIPIARALIGVAERGSDEAFQAEVTTFLRTLVDLGQEQARQNSSLAEEIAGLATMIRDASGDREALLAWAEDSFLSSRCSSRPLSSLSGPLVMTTSVRGIFWPNWTGSIALMPLRPWSGAGTR